MPVSDTCLGASLRAKVEDVLQARFWPVTRGFDTIVRSTLLVTIRVPMTVLCLCIYGSQQCSAAEVHCWRIMVVDLVDIVPLHAARCVALSQL